jgi:hypothetical protein
MSNAELLREIESALNDPERSMEQKLVLAEQVAAAGEHNASYWKREIKLEILMNQPTRQELHNGIGN